LWKIAETISREEVLSVHKQTPTKLNQEQLNVLSSIVANNNDATLDELRMF